MAIRRIAVVGLKPLDGGLCLGTFYAIGRTELIAQPDEQPLSFPDQLETGRRPVKCHNFRLSNSFAGLTPPKREIYAAGAQKDKRSGQPPDDTQSTGPSPNAVFGAT